MNVQNNNIKNNEKYISFNVRLISVFLLCLIFFLSSYVFFTKSIQHSQNMFINYKETSNIDYKVALKPNDFYEEEYLSKDMIYVASLIEKVEIDFDYLFSIDELTNIDFDYDIVAKLEIKNQNKDKIYFTKDYTLLKNRKYKMINKNSFELNEKVKIDYNYYNELATKFKNVYGVETVSDLVITLNINKESLDETLKFSSKDISELSITIPLSEKSINISMIYKDINNNSNLVKASSTEISNILFLVIAALCFIIFIIFTVIFIKMIKLLFKSNNKYDKYIGKILREYDRLIVETTSEPIMENKELIKVNSFKELLDVRDNLKVPIMYYIITKHQKCYFYICHNEKVYLNIVKAVDLEKKDE